jgi:hypothetical protein
MTNVYGSLVGTVKANGEITFDFHKISESDTPAAVKTRYGAEFVHWCFTDNTDVK